MAYRTRVLLCLVLTACSSTTQKVTLGDVVDPDTTAPPDDSSTDVSMVPQELVAPALISFSPTSPSNSQTPSLIGTARAGASVSVFANGDCSGTDLATVTVSDTGVFAIPIVAMVNTTTVYSARATKDGITSVCSATLSYTHDDTQPAQPSITLNAANPSPSNAAAPLVDITGELGSSALFFLNGTCTGLPQTVEVLLEGAQTLSAPVATQNGTNQLSVQVRDAAGNLSVCVNITYVHDDVAPTVSLSNLQIPGNITFTYAAADSQTGVNEVAYCDATTPSDCNSVFATSPLLGPTGTFGSLSSTDSAKRHYVRLRATDAAGNVGYSGLLSIRGNSANVVRSVGVGTSTSFAILASGSTQAWGEDLFSQCGAATGAVGDERATPVYVSNSGIGNLRGLVSISGGDSVGSLSTNTGAASHICGTTVDGYVYCWGDDGQGQDGDGSSTHFGFPRPAQLGSLFPAIGHAEGTSHSCAVTAKGIVACWGTGVVGELANGSTGATNTSDAPIAAQVSLGVEYGSVRAVSAGSNFTCALQTNSEVLCWGKNNNGELGVSGATGGRLFAAGTTVRLGATGLSGVKDIGSGVSHTCALRDDGTVACWGLNSARQIGTTSVQAYASAQVISGVSGAVSLAVGFDFNCVLTVDGRTQCWGSGDKGQLGLAGPTSLTGPRSIQTLAAVDYKEATQLSAGFDHVCARTVSGRADCWGDNTRKQTHATLANNDFLSPETVNLNNFTSETIGGIEISAGDGFTCALLSDGSVECFGKNDLGQLGVTGPTSSVFPVTVPLSAPMKSLVSGTAHSCTLSSVGAVSCWGDIAGPTGLTGLPPMQALAAGDAFTCGLSGDGRVFCWGDNSEGQRGTNLASPSPVILANMTTLRGIVEITAGSAHACALKSNGDTFCWGRNTSAQLGVGNATLQSFANAATAFTGTRRISAGGDTTCAVTQTGGINCVGSNSFGQIDPTVSGAFTTAAVAMHFDVSTLVANASQLHVGARHSCFVVGGSVSCIGDNSTRQIGDVGVTEPIRTYASAVNFKANVFDDNTYLTDGLRVAVGSHHTCVLSASGRAACFGANDSGELGFPASTTPIAIPSYPPHFP